VLAVIEPVTEIWLLGVGAGGSSSSSLLQAEKANTDAIANIERNFFILDSQFCLRKTDEGMLTECYA
jgi:hypothetical protein